MLKLPPGFIKYFKLTYGVNCESEDIYIKKIKITLE